MKRRTSMLLSTTLFLSGCYSYSSDEHLAPGEQWGGSKLTGNTATCAFPWIIETVYASKKVLYTDPQLQQPPWVVTFSDLDKSHPSVIFRDAGRSRAEEGWQAVQNDEKVTLVMVSDVEKNISTLTLHRDNGIAVFSEHSSVPITAEPRGRVAMGWCK